MAAKRRETPRLAGGEVELLGVLWRASAGLTIAEVQRGLPRPAGYTTVQTRLNRLVKKGVARRSAARPARYRAAISPDQVTQGDLDFLLERVTSGRVAPLAAHLLRDRDVPADELAQLRRMLAEAEARTRKREDSAR